MNTLIFFFLIIKQANAKRIKINFFFLKKDPTKTNVLCIRNGRTLSQKKKKKRVEKQKEEKDKKKSWLLAFLLFINNKCNHACFLSISGRQFFVGPSEKFLGLTQKFTLLTRQHPIPFSLIYIFIHSIPLWTQQMGVTPQFFFNGLRIIYITSSRGRTIDLITRNIGSELRYGLGKVLGTQNRLTLRLASFHYVLCLNPIKGILNIVSNSHTHQHTSSNQHGIKHP